MIKYTEAINDYNHKRYNKVIDSLLIYTLNGFDDDVYYYLSMSYLKTNNIDLFLNYAKLYVNNYKNTVKSDIYLPLFNTLLNKNDMISAYKVLINMNNLNLADHYQFYLLGHKFKNKCQKKSLECFNLSIKINDKFVPTYNSIGCIFHNEKNYSEAIKNFEYCIKLNNNYCDAYHNLGVTYTELNDFDNGIKNYNKILTIKKQDPDCLFNMSTLLLKFKYFEKGFIYYEFRLKCKKLEKTYPKITDKLENWDGKANCKKLLIVYEQGIGDNIQFYRYIMELSDIYPNMKLTFFCKKNIIHLFKKNDKITLISELPNNVEKLLLPFLSDLIGCLRNLLNTHWHALVRISAARSLPLLIAATLTLIPSGKEQH